MIFETNFRELPKKAIYFVALFLIRIVKIDNKNKNHDSVLMKI